MVIVNGMRAVRYIDQLKRVMEAARHIILWVESSSTEILYERYVAREGIFLSREDFDKKLIADVELGVDTLKSAAHITILNDGTVEELYRKGDRLIKQLGISTDFPRVLG